MLLLNAGRPQSVALITSQAFSLINFRGSLISALVEKGIHVYALAPDYSDDFRKHIVELGADPIDIYFVRTGMNPLRDLLDMCKLGLTLRRLQPDVTLGYFAKPVIYGTLAARLAKVQRRVAMIEGLGYVFTTSGVTLSWKRRLLRAVVSGLYRVALAQAHQVLFLNRDDIADFVQGGVVDGEKVNLLDGIGVELSEWERVPPVEFPITFLLAARLLREKGIPEYAAAARQVKIQYPETRFILLGGLDPNPGGLSQSDVEAWVSEGLLEWPGHVSVKPWLAQTSVYVLPSYYREGLPRSTQEAMAMGRPVITTDAPGCRETVVDGVNGYLVPVRDSRALADAMIRFIEDPNRIYSMGLESRKMAEERFDVHKINKRLLGILGVE